MSKNLTHTDLYNKKKASPAAGMSFEAIALAGPGLNAILSFPDLKLHFVNNQFQRHLGYDNDEIAGGSVNFNDIIEHYQLDRFLYQLERAKNDVDARSHYVLYRLRGKDGQAHPYYVYAMPANEDLGEDEQCELYAISLHPDLSKWALPFTSFITRELFLEHFNTENFGTFEWLTEIDKIFWSPGVYHIYEISNLEQFVDQKFSEQFIHPNDRETLQLAIQKAMDTGEEMNIDYRIITARHNVKIIHCLAQIVKDHHGKIVKFAGSIRDVTAQRSIEEDLKKKVRELYHSNKELEEFAYVASHDMQEPLRKITTFSDRLSEKYKDVLTGDGAMYLSRMTNAAENMRRLINDLLEFSRISKTPQPFEKINLNEILRQVRTELELTIEETKTVINSAPLPTIEAIPSLMKQLFSNIMGNAIKFHKPNVSPIITIKTSELTEEEVLAHDLAPGQSYFEITLSDNGIGFDNEYATRIFQVFQRLHGKSEYPGSGIGLAICKKITEYHHGLIYAEGAEDGGATFTFILPQQQTTN